MKFKEWRETTACTDLYSIDTIPNLQIDENVSNQVILFFHAFDDRNSQERHSSWISTASVFSKVEGLRFAQTDTTPLLFEGIMD